MKRLLTILTGLLALQGCAGCGKQALQGTPTDHYTHIVEQFSADLQTLGYKSIDISKLTITHVEDLKYGEAAILGYCYAIQANPKFGVTITFANRLEAYTEDVQMAMVYHELGHCYLGLPDTTGHKIMNNTDNRRLFTYDEMYNKDKRLQLVKQMLESSSYR